MKTSARIIVISALLTWAVGLFMPVFAQNLSSANSSVPSIAGTTWVGPDTMGKHYTYEFLPDGTLHYTYETGSFTDGIWKQDGDSIYMAMNNKYSERLGQITGTHMQGDAWNVNGQKWTWEADLKSSAQAPTLQQQH
jgi:hypothetical protein